MDITLTFSTLLTISRPSRYPNCALPSGLLCTRFRSENKAGTCSLVARITYEVRERERSCCCFFKKKKKNVWKWPLRPLFHLYSRRLQEARRPLRSSAPATAFYCPSKFPRLSMHMKLKFTNNQKKIIASRSSGSIYIYARDYWWLPMDSAATTLTRGSWLLARDTMRSSPISAFCLASTF